ncbi:MAG: YaeQ family protein [Bacteriovoracaceae bacterium]|nr:YaeQ family protein [Bacteriovoracaceae bacterium]
MLRLLMALTVTLYRFQIELSDINRGVYETIDFRVAQHPSESTTYMLTRLIAYVLNFQEGLAFSPTGLHDPDAAAISIDSPHGGHELLIEIGNPSARKLHKATKVSRAVKVYTYKNPESLISEILTEKVHRAQEIEVFSLKPSFLTELEEVIKRDNRWAILFDDGTISVQVGERSIAGELQTHVVL